MPGCSGATKSASLPRTDQGGTSQAVSVTPRSLWNGCQRPWAQFAGEAWCPPKINLKICQVLDLKSFNKSSTVLKAAFLSLTLSLQSPHAPVSHDTTFLSYLCSTLGRAPHKVPPNLLSSSALGSLPISSHSGSAQVPCSPATLFGTLCRFCQARNSSEQQHTCPAVKLSPVS